MIYMGSSLGFVVALWESGRLSCYHVDPLSECVVARAKGVENNVN